MAARAWDSARQQVAVYVERRRRARLALSESVFARINAHIRFQDHRGNAGETNDEIDDESAQGGEDALEDAAGAGEDLALDFLGDVNADDMKALLVDAAVGTTPVAASMAPIEMPTHLLSTAPATAVTATTTATLSGITVGASLGEDASVSKLMDELQIDVHALVPERRRSEDEPEAKTEESTPPRHVREQRVQRKEEIRRETSPKKTKQMNPLVPDEDAVAVEMFKWVDGERHPDVVRRKETLRDPARRRVPKIYGSQSREEQATIQKAVKYYTAVKDASSSSDDGNEDSDFSPSEVAGVGEDEEDRFNETELLSDDFIDDEEEEIRRPKNRRRIRQRKAPPKPKKVRATKSARSATAKTHRSSADRIGEAHVTTNQRTKSVETTPQPPMDSQHAIDLRSDSDDENMPDASVEPDQEIEEEVTTISSADEDGDSKNSLVLKLKVSPLELLQITSKEKTTACSTDPAPVNPRYDSIQNLTSELASSEVMTIQLAENSLDSFVEDEEGYGTDEIEDDVVEDLHTETGNHVVEPASTFAGGVDGLVETTSVFGRGVEEDLSDTGTIDFEQEELDEPEPSEPDKDTSESNQIVELNQDEEEVGERVKGAATAEPIVEAIEAQKEGSEGQRDASALRDGGDRSSPPFVSSGGIDNNKLHPVEPNLKMSPQQTIPSPKTRILTDEATESRDDDGGVSDAETVNFEDVTSDIDFGSGESDDFGGDDMRTPTTRMDENDDGDDGEFVQFFDTGVKNVPKKAPIVPAVEAMSADATPVKVISTDDMRDDSSPLTATKTNPILTTSSAIATTGSNGLRKVPNINTTTVARGKYQQTRRAVQLLDENMKPSRSSSAGETHDPKRMLMRGRFNSGSVAPISPTHVNPLQLRGDKGPVNANVRYLGYSKASPSEPKLTAKEQFSAAAKRAREKYDKSSTRTPTQAESTEVQVAFASTYVGTGAGILKPLQSEPSTDAKDMYVPPRDPQMDIYDATGAKSQIDDDYRRPSDFGNHKRPIKFVKDVEEAKRNGVNVKKGIPEELDPNAKIPKKSKKQLAQERSAAAVASAASDRAGNSKEDAVERKSKKSKKGKTQAASDKPSKYGPSDRAMQPDFGRARKDEQRHRDNKPSRDGGATGSRKRRRSPSPVSSHRGHERDKERFRERDHRDREWERDRKREWSREKDRGRDMSRDRECDERSRDRHRRSCSRSPIDNRYRSRRSESPPTRKRSDSFTRGHSPSRSRYMRRAHDEHCTKRDLHKEDGWRQLPSYESAIELLDTLKQPPRRKEELSPARESKTQRTSGALAAFRDDDGSDIANSDIEFIDELDDDDVDTSQKGRDIRLNLKAIPVDESRRKRMIYVCNLAHRMTEGDLEEIFGRFGLDVDPETGYPAIEVFLSQRTHRARGDARITFIDADGARHAVEEKNAAMEFDAKLIVRAMDPSTFRILTAQFDQRRDTWKCSNSHCQNDVSVWSVVCPTCHVKRVFPGSNTKIRSEDWLCSICYSSNDKYTDKCSGCHTELPPLNSAHAASRRFHG